MTTIGSIIPLPGETVDGDTIMASVLIATGPVQTLALLLTDTPGEFYRLVVLIGWEVSYEIGRYPNIVPAVEAYQNNGGDY